MANERFDRNTDLSTQTGSIPLPAGLTR